MFVRWERRSLESGRGRGCRLEAILMQNDEEKGVIKKKIIASLATIEERFLEAKEIGIRGFHRGIFWTEVDKKLKDLNIGNVPRNMIEAEILRKVPRPTSNDWSLYAVTCVPRYDE